MSKKKVADMTPEEHRAKLQAAKEWRARNKESIRVSAKKYGQKNRAKLNEYNNKWRREKYAVDPTYRKERNDSSMAYYKDTIKSSPVRFQEFRETTKQAQRRLRDRLQEVRKQLQQVLGGKCVDCGIADYRLLDFDHKDPKSKLMLLSQNLHLGFEVLLPEAKKCELRCPNCHRLKTITKGEYNGYKNREFRNKFRAGFRSLISVRTK